MIRVFFNSNFIEDGFNEELTGELTELGYILSDNLEAAYEICQNISEDCWVADIRFKPTSVSRKDNIRSFSMGDVVERNGTQYICALVGFKEIQK